MTRSWGKRVLLMAVAAILAATAASLIAEAYFRLTGRRSYVPDPGITADRTLGWDTVPAVAPLGLNNGRSPVVIFAGDSFTDRKEWPDQAQRRLREHGIEIDGFNLGVTGFGTAQELLKLEQHAARLRARAIVVLFFAWNDLRDDYPYPELVYGPQRAARPYLLIRDGRMVRAPVQWTSNLHAELLRSEVYLRLFNRVALRANAKIVERWPNLPATLEWRAKLYYEDAVSWHPFYDPAQASTPYVQGAYDATMAAFRAIRDLAGSLDATLLVIGIDNAFTVDRDVFDHYVRPFPSLDASLPLTRIARLLADEHIPFINAQPALAELGRRIGRVYNGPEGGLGLAGHLQPDADRLIGDIASRWLTAQPLTP